MGTLPNSEGTDEIQHNAAFHQGLHCLLGLKQPSGKEIKHSLASSVCDLLNYTMGSPIVIVSDNMYGKIHQNTKRESSGRVLD